VNTGYLAFINDRNFHVFGTPENAESVDRYIAPQHLGQVGRIHLQVRDISSLCNYYRKIAATKSSRAAFRASV
jgi:catechol-2,3-dioxygenase